MTPNRKRTLIRLIAAAFGFAVLLSAVSTHGQDFQFDASISRQILENYLNRSISFAELLHDDLDEPRNKRGVDPRDHMRLILSSKAKFVGRAILVWGQEESLPDLLRTAKLAQSYIDAGIEAIHFGQVALMDNLTSSAGH
jgi:hypothetical protein